MPVVSPRSSPICKPLVAPIALTLELSKGLQIETMRGNRQRCLATEESYTPDEIVTIILRSIYA